MSLSHTFNLGGVVGVLVFNFEVPRRRSQFTLSAPRELSALELSARGPPFQPQIGAVRESRSAENRFRRSHKKRFSFLFSTACIRLFHFDGLKYGVGFKEFPLLSLAC